jgi:hypothetical protein
MTEETQSEGLKNLCLRNNCTGIYRVGNFLCNARQLLFLIATFYIFASGCVSTVKTSEAFPEIDRIENELQRGLTRKPEVERVLGRPTGIGGALLPTNQDPREVWFYQDVKVTGYQALGKESIGLNVRQQILLIFFDSEVYDGHMWYTNTGRGQAW